VCGSKPVHATKGYYDGADAFISYHPHFTNTAIRDTECGSYCSAVFTFETTEPEKWIDKSLIPTTHTSHAAARCPGAIDALCLMYTTTKYIKEAMFPHTGTWTLNEFVLVGGDATSDNLPPRFSPIQYSWRSPALGIQQQIYTVLEKNARHVAEMTGCRASVRWVTKTRVGLTNHAMTDLTFANMELVDAPRFSGEARDFARQIQSHLGLTPMENPFLDDNKRLMPPSEYEARLRRALPEWQTHYTSDDYVDCTWHAPTVRLLTMRPRLRPPSPDYEYPAWAHNALGGLPAAINPGIFLGARRSPPPCSTCCPNRPCCSSAGRIPRTHRRRNRRHEMGSAAAAQGFRTAGRSALARIHPDRARRRMVDPNPGLRLRRRRPALIAEQRRPRGGDPRARHHLGPRTSPISPRVKSLCVQSRGRSPDCLGRPARLSLRRWITVIASS
jgi:metal-dependent amidase/aminoacylase/carboxypeptidase family protein